MTTKNPAIKSVHNGRNKRGNSALLIWDIPESVKEKFKHAVLKRKTSMRRVILKFMQDYSTTKLNK